MTAEQIKKANAELAGKSPLEIVKWAVAQADGRAIVSTNFRPFEAVILHLATQAQADMPVLWVDHGYNRPATYQHAEALKKMLRLNIQPFLPKISAAHFQAVCGDIPSPGDEENLKKFSKLVKLEPFQRGMKELAPTVWITALRKSQNENRAGFDIVSFDETFNCLKVNPILNLTDADLENYLKKHTLPNEWDYFDPAKADEKRECGLHINWGATAMKTK
ncbi:MAG TPA: phosphoadenosine phosphosulfate reductase family protein [Candidatus Sulfotelmatobacter sp.]|jgi:phosphoadenosine phosphosulfate reductase|nr:phosphoadenosine phosphosulfate reductase family protein [Candidatus Sulfotelmatobacter sp.]